MSLKKEIIMHWDYGWGMGFGFGWLFILLFWVLVSGRTYVTWRN